MRERLVPVVCGADILGYAYIRSYHEAYGIKPIILSSVDVKVTSSSKFCDYRVVPEVSEEEGLVETLKAIGRELAAQGKVGIVHGSADWNTRIISAHKEELSEWYVVPYIDFALLDEITQKDRFYELCEELGMDYPKTWYVDCAADAEPLDSASFPYPLVAKPSHSASYDLLDFPGKKKVYEIETPEELERAVAAVRASSYDHPTRRSPSATRSASSPSASSASSTTPRASSSTWAIAGTPTSTSSVTTATAATASSRSTPARARTPSTCRSAA